VNWNHTLTNRLADWLRFAIRGSVLIAGIAATLGFTYVTVKLCWFTVRWLDRVWFGNGPW